MWNMQMYGMTHEWMISCAMIMNVLVLSDPRTPSKSLDLKGGFKKEGLGGIECDLYVQSMNIGVNKCCDTYGHIVLPKHVNCAINELM